MSAHRPGRRKVWLRAVCAIMAAYAHAPGRPPAHRNSSPFACRKKPNHTAPPGCRPATGPRYSTHVSPPLRLRAPARTPAARAAPSPRELEKDLHADDGRQTSLRDRARRNWRAPASPCARHQTAQEGDVRSSELTAASPRAFSAFATDKSITHSLSMSQADLSAARIAGVV